MKQHLDREPAVMGAEVHMPQDTEWGQHEGTHVDLDGNILRFRIAHVVTT